ncbi:MAG TPA: protein kinase [Vicinamibacteria bacterium]|nr:protein kinase [Vicinamibacteria bacterium]
MGKKTESFEQMPGGRYEIVARLGTGAFGSVYHAQDTFLNRPVAVKSIRLDTTLDPEHRKALNKRFIREAQVAAQLHHPNIVTIHDILFTPETGFIVMEFIDGRTLQSLLKAERLPLARALEIAAQVASGLQYAHEHKIIHRDVKPANIMITPSFEARITDFGIAKSDGSTHLTMSGSLVGTPDYMSPEQAKGEDVDSRSDIFSLGCVLFECAAGEKPFKGGSLTGVLLSIVNNDPFGSKAWKSQGLPSALEAILKRALAKEPDKRYSTAAELVTALRALDYEPVPAMPAKEVARPDEMLQWFKEEERPLKFATTLSDELHDISLTPAQGFILSRIDGASRARDILALSPMPEVEVAATLADLIEKGLLAWGESGASPDRKSSDTATRRRGARPKPKGLDETFEREMERILDLAGQKRYEELFGVSEQASSAEIKKSYLELIERFHPDSQKESLDAASKMKLSKVCAVATEAMTALSTTKNEEPPKAPPPPRDRKPKPQFDRSTYAEELFRLGQRAYDTANYWEAIQLARQAIELDAERAEYHHLLGIGLMKNLNWLKEAAECLRKASELDPTNAEYFGLLATVYKAEGLSEDSASMLEKAKSLDPSYC